ncbi:DUF397 domain-containing protein [Actinoplanes palleronii]|uniref:DUF397 domain-containing protein n=1 Tax=Actinoplanes palleronii TaxID=113570 RepID=A0ABQ4BS81_9ACTN|nr:DUF397 domain-containing protein [Actinoplanes palleronii]GIE73544.1 hypothetical protein Apa02nite_096520 [Actinoplanes palleronii]
MEDKGYGHINQSELAWRKGSRSSGSGSDCVEVADLPDGGFALRDSKDPNGSTLFFTPSERAAFVAGVREEHLP